MNPIITDWSIQQLKLLGRPTDLVQDFYEYDGPDDVQVPLYFSDGE
jgi:hypothetical protein